MVRIVSTKQFPAAAQSFLREVNWGDPVDTGDPAEFEEVVEETEYYLEPSSISFGVSILSR